MNTTEIHKINDPRVWIAAINFKNGSKVQLNSTDVVIFVGPNNSGKSATLRGIHGKLDTANFQSPIVDSIEIVRHGTTEEITSWVESWGIKNFSNDGNFHYHFSMGTPVHKHQMVNVWENAKDLQLIRRWFCNFLTADERLSISNPPRSIELSKEAPNHPIHYLQRDDQIEKRLSEQFRKAFDEDLIIHRNAGNAVPLFVGTRPEPSPGEDRVSLSYIQKIEALPSLQTQGDGMRSFAGVLLGTSVGRESILLIDEPEAFLHPPQARLLGSMIVQDRRKERQLLVATHSTDVLKGVLDVKNDDVRVLRIRREGHTNIIKELDNQRIKNFWKDPHLRYSNVLDGLFHQCVVICEGDADCRFYDAVLGALLEIPVKDNPRPDMMFTHCGGKSRIPMTARALREIDVPIQVVLDFDVLNDEVTLRGVIEAFGAKWAEYEPLWRITKTAIDKKKPNLAIDEVRIQVNLALDRDAGKEFLDDHARLEINKILRRASPWTHAKEVGRGFIPAGQATATFDSLLVKLQVLGIHILEVGELEGFARSIGNHGPKWVNSVLERNLATDVELKKARDFVNRILKHAVHPKLNDNQE